MSTTSSHTTRQYISEPSIATRAVHFVGSLPPELLGNDRTTMQWFLDHTCGTRLTALPCDRDPRWIISWLDNLASVPAFEAFRTGASANYDDMPTYRIAQGCRLEPEDVSLRRTGETLAAIAARDHLDTGFTTLPPQQVSVPNALDLALFTFGSPTPAMAHLAVFRQAVVDDVIDIHERWGQEVVFQLETPAVLATFHRTPRPLWPGLAQVLARQTAQIITSAPQSARWLLHLCHGDLAHEPLFPLRDLVPAVQFLNALHKRLRKHQHAMPAVHIPMCTGTSGPSTEVRFYRALRHLRRDINVIAGLVDEKHPEDSTTALRLAETELDRPAIAVAAACGHGRRTVAAATANTALACDLVRTSTDHLAR